MRYSAIIGVSILVGCLIIALFGGTNVSGQAPAGGIHLQRRYQVVVGQPGGSGHPHYFMLVDGDTGQCWMRTSADRQWRDYGLPVSKAEND